MSQIAPKSEGNSPGILDKAETFGESDVTVSHTDTEVSGGSVALSTVDGTTVSRTVDDSTASLSSSRGDKFNPNTDIDGLKVNISSVVGSFSTVFICDMNDNIVVEDTSGHSGGDTVTLKASLSAGTAYYIGAYNDGNSATWEYYSSPSYPYSTSDFDVTKGVEDPHPNDGTPSESEAQIWLFSDFTAIKDATSGTTYVEWSYPSDTFAWDVAPFQYTPDGETVDVYVEEDQSGSWTEIAGPISRGDDIPADASNNVRYRVEFSRSSTANNPTLDAIYRRRVV